MDAEGAVIGTVDKREGLPTWMAKMGQDQGFLVMQAMVLKWIFSRVVVGYISVALGYWTVE